MLGYLIKKVLVLVSVLSALAVILPLSCGGGPSTIDLSVGFRDDDWPHGSIDGVRWWFVGPEVFESGETSMTGLDSIVTLTDLSASEQYYLVSYKEGYI
jgi:hypothetical protein